MSVVLEEVPDSFDWHEATRRAENSTLVRGLRETSLQIDDAGKAVVHLTQSSYRDGTPSLSIQFNPARVLDPNGFSPLPTGTLHLALARVEEAIRRDGRVRLAGPLRNGKVTEWDYAWDMVSVSPSAHFIALASRHVAYVRGDKRLHFDGSTPSGALVGTKAWSVSAYHKGPRARGAQQGLVRFEVRSRRDNCDSTLTNTLQAYDDGRIRAEALVKVRRCGLDNPVHLDPARTLVASAIARGYSGVSLAAPLGWMYCEQLGFPVEVSPNTRTKYRRFLTENGVSVAPDDFTSGGRPIHLVASDPPMSLQLDFEGHKEIRRHGTH